LLALLQRAKTHKLSLTRYRLPSGITDEATWRKLLGDGAYDELAGGGDAGSADSNGGTHEHETSTSAAAPLSSPPAIGADAGAGSPDKYAKWPVVMDQDGGREVHALHIALEAQGYHCGEDEMTWWMFGERTLNALKTFQVRARHARAPCALCCVLCALCSVCLTRTRSRACVWECGTYLFFLPLMTVPRLPRVRTRTCSIKLTQACAGIAESSVCDERTWRALLGDNAMPDDILALKSQDYEQDMTEQEAAGAVWLLGEQRWSRPV
jgi:hypothetical protein